MEEGPCIVFVASAGLARALYGWAAAAGYQVEVHSSLKDRLAALRAPALALGRWFVFMAGCVLRAASAAWIAPRKSKAENYDVLLATIAEPNAVQEDGTFSDRHLPGLYEFLISQGKSVAVLPYIHHFGFSYVSILRKLRRAKARFLFPEDDLRLTDYLWVWMYPFRALLRPVPAGSFRGVDITPLIREEWRGEGLCSGLQPALVHRWLIRLARQGMKFSRAILWHENRMEDKAMVLGLRQGFPGTRIMGAQIFLYTPLWLSFRTSAFEVKAGVAPDVLLEPSERQVGLARSFTPDIDSRVVPALRYSHIYNAWPARDVPGEARLPVVLVSLSFRITMAAETLDMLAEALKKTAAPLHIILRPHPDLRMEELYRARGLFPRPEYEIDRGPLDVSLSRADILLASTSSIVVEAAVRGLPVVFVHGESLLDSDPAGEPNIPAIAECYGADDMARALDRFAALGPEERKLLRENGALLRDKFFTPVNAETMRAFLGD